MAQAPMVRNQRILIIDDNRSIHEDVRKILGVIKKEDEELDEAAAALFGVPVEASASVTFEIDSAFQGQDGLAMVRAALEEGRPYALAFVDVRMPPGWDGIETISRIWKSYPELQVVICTAYADYSWEEMIRKVGGTDNLVILKKPFDNVEVLQLAHTLTQKWSTSHHLQLHLHNLDAIVASRTEELQAANAQLRKEMAERAQTQRELARSEERFTRAFQASPIPMAIQDLGSRLILDVNEAFLAMTGFPRAEVVGHGGGEFQLWAEEARGAEMLALLRTEKSVRHHAGELRSRSGAPRPCLLFGEIFSFGDDEVALLAALDVSEQRRLEEQLRQAQKLEAVGQLAAGVAHDFNNILTVIQGHVTMQLAAASHEESLANSLHQVSAAAERATSLTRQLLTFSRKQVVQRKVLNLNTVVRHLHDMMGRLIGAHIDFRCLYGERLPGICADRSNLEQILMNVVVNARDAMPEGGTLLVSTAAETIDAAQAARRPQARAGDFVRLCVADSGMGMSEETLSHVFEPFFTTKEVGKGTGLGLATVYGIVAQHDGWIEVVSKVGDGTSISIYLPATEIAPEVLFPVAGEDVLRGGNETILLVEDEPDVRDVVAGILELQGYHVLTAADGPDALALWEEHRSGVDLLITDIVMPNGMKGNELAERLRGESPELKVIFSSGYSPDFATAEAPLAARRDLPAETVQAGGPGEYRAQLPRRPRAGAGRIKIFPLRSRGGLKEERQKLREVAAPDRPGMTAFGELPLQVHAAFFELRHQRLIARAQKVVLSYRQPEQLQQRKAPLLAFLLEPSK